MSDVIIDGEEIESVKQYFKNMNIDFFAKERKELKSNLIEYIEERNNS